jgi:hypothetical protein
MRVPFSLTLLLLSVVLARPAWPESSDAPGTVGPFVTFCQTNFEDCYGKITEIQLDALSQDLAADTHNSCSVPRGIEPEAGAHAIVDWLAQHPQNAGLATDAGVKAAIKGLWNCQAKVATGMTSGGVPDNTGRYVAFCKDAKNYVDCANKSGDVSMDAFAEELMSGSSTHCQAPKGTKTQEIYAKVIAWLGGHPETYTSETEVGIAAAIDATWPCK